LPHHPNRRHALAVSGQDFEKWLKGLWLAQAEIPLRDDGVMAALIHGAASFGHQLTSRFILIRSFLELKTWLV
jgi:isopentenyl phosphate kinase